MDPERWKRIDEIFHAALEHQPSTRAAYLVKACKGDSSLQAEIEALIHSHEKDSSFLETPAPILAAELLATQSSPDPPLDGLVVSHYRILQKIGGGGMGVVYEAVDTELERHVALKFLPADVAGDKIALERFRREARTASALNHPNICTIYEIARHGAQPFIVMELMRGQTLKQIIGGKAMPVSQVLDVAIQVVDAMKAAHANGIIHRDIKSANIFVNDRQNAKLLDFGLAKYASQAAASDQLTRGGHALGTVAYMSPEQARGKDLDVRTDLYSFGVVLYEMVTGRLPFSGDTTGELLEAIFASEPAPPSKMNRDIPQRLEEIIGKALKKDRDMRYAGAAELLEELQQVKSDLASEPPTVPGRPFMHRAARKSWLLSAFVFLLLTVFAVSKLSRDTKTPPGQPIAPTPTPATQKVSIAVLPFVDMSPDKSQEYFTDGLSEELINVLSRNRSLKVVARTSSFSFKGKNEDLRTIAQKLGVGRVLEGSVRKEGSRIRITTQLINAADGFHIWSQSYDRELNDIFAVQDEIAVSVAEALKVALEGKTAPRNEYKPKLEAYNLYLQGSHFRHSTRKEGLEKAKRYFEQAIQVDPKYSRPWIGLSIVHNVLGEQGYLPYSEASAESRRCLQRALQLDPDSPPALTRLATFQISEWDWSGSEASFQRAMAAAPQSTSILGWASTLQAVRGNLDEAIRMNQRSIQGDPLVPILYSNHGEFCFAAGRLDEAKAAFEKALELDPYYAGAHARMGCVYLWQSEKKAALDEMHKETEVRWRLYGLALAYHAAGKSQESDRALQELIQKHLNGMQSQVAAIYAYRGEPDKAFEWLEHAYQVHDPGLLAIKIDPLLHNLRGDPRYQAIVKKMNLPL